MPSRWNQGTIVIAAIDQLLVGWIRWENGKPAEHRMELVASGQIRHSGPDLGYLDQAKWEVDNNGKPRDPWQNTAYLPLLLRLPEICGRSAPRAKEGMVRSAN